jgi:hypothetical protein
MCLKIQYPWEKVEKGYGFFVPCVDPVAVREDGLKRAVFMRILDARATIGIRNKLMGVWFYR